MRTSNVAAQVDVPDLVRQRAMSNGTARRRWLEALPDVIAALADQWGLEVGVSLPAQIERSIIRLMPFLINSNIRR